MEEIIEKVPHYKEVRDGFKEVKKFKCSDGKVFNSFQSASEHEKQLEFEKIWKTIEKIDCHGNDVGPNIDFWYRPKNEEELNMLLTHFHYGRAGYYSEGEIAVGKWIGYEYIDNGDYQDHHYVYEMELLKRQTDEYWKMFEGK